MGAGILLSRLSGIVRDAAVAFYLGSGRQAEVFFAGLKTPNLLQNLLGEGTLSASFIPVYAGFLEEGEDEEAGRFAGAVLGLLAVTAYGAALLGVLAAPLLVQVLVPRWDPASQALLARVMRILFPMTATLVLSAWALGILNSHRRFFVSYVAPVLWNGALVVALVVAGAATYASPESRADELVVALAWGGLIGGVLQLSIQLPFIGRNLATIRPSFGRGVAGVGEAIRNFGPVVAARGALNLSALVDVFLAGLLVEGAVAHLSRAQTLYLLPISLFGMAVAAAELPELSRQGPKAAATLAPRIRGALERVRFLLIPSAAAYLTFGDLLVAGLYQRGAFGAADSQVVGWVLAGYALGLPASGSSRTLSSAFYALRDTGTPARLALARIAVSLAIGAALIFPLDGIRIQGFGLGTLGLALGASTAAWVEYGLLRRRLRERVGPHGPDSGGLVRLLAAAAAASIAGWGVRRWVWPQWIPEGLEVAGFGVSLLVQAVGTAGVFGVIYLVLAGGSREAIPFLRRRS